MSCILCEVGTVANHPKHPEAPRCGDYDYKGLQERRRQERRQRERRLASKLFRAQCEDKDRYGSEKVARLYAKRTYNPSVHAYYCRMCRWWHIGKGDRIVGAIN